MNIQIPQKYQQLIQEAAKLQGISEEEFVVKSAIDRLKDLQDKKLLEETSEELDAIQIYDEAIASDDEAIPFEQAIAEIEENR